LIFRVKDEDLVVLKCSILNGFFGLLVPFWANKLHQSVFTWIATGICGEIFLAYLEDACHQFPLNKQKKFAIIFFT
jgi:hypothetical protein